ncbi:hypothetical protein Q3O59_13140 [Alkalimonas delamerensis]|uniref:DUF2846 domain-containing protein n=1 Tax=Alkalimonas delamerensis TaxID=265981 RepID=A0ABT9GSL2_9GAMM|nr:hypothetical protein [Alkalimonas delamerensis]MDP4529968.1 hypothetical protein [Alkalimonas delamerensis]
MRVWLIALLLFSTHALAQFDVTGSGIAYLKDGSHQTFDFGFTYTRKDGQNVFIVGRQSVNVPSVPQLYSVALVLHHEQFVWATDFINQPLIGFELIIGKHQVKLYQEDGLAAPGSYVIEIDGVRHQFVRGRNIGQLDFNLNDQGLESITPRGLLRPGR